MRKLISIVLSILVLLTLYSYNVYAEEPNINESITEFKNMAQSTVDSYLSGKDITIEKNCITEENEEYNKIVNMNNEYKEVLNSGVLDNILERLLETKTVEVIKDYESERNELGLYFSNKPKRPLILDMDLSSDVDDLCALSIACTLDKMGVFDLKGVMYSIGTENDMNISALNGFLINVQGLNNVLVGKCENEYIGDSPYWNDMGGCGDNRTNVDMVTRQYRKILANSTEKVDIVTTGYVENLMYLLKSQADDISEKSGLELVTEKVGQLYVVGGAYPSGIDNNFIIIPDSMVGADYISVNWPYPIVYLTSNVGGKLVCGKYLQQLDRDNKYNVTRGLYSFGTGVGRAAWDPFGVFVCAFGNNKDIGQVDFIRTDITVNPMNGVNSFSDNENGRHFRVVCTNENKDYYNRLMDSFLICNL